MSKTHEVVVNVPLKFVVEGAKTNSEARYKALREAIQAYPESVNKKKTAARDSHEPTVLVVRNFETEEPPTPASA